MHNTNEAVTDPFAKVGQYLPLHVTLPAVSWHVGFVCVGRRVVLCCTQGRMGLLPTMVRHGLPMTMPSLIN